MKKLTLLILAIASLASVSSCGTKQEAVDAHVETDSAVAASASVDSIFKYTITTDIDANNDNIEILVAMNSVDGQYPVKYDLDCEGDGEFEYRGSFNQPLESWNVSNVPDMSEMFSGAISFNQPIAAWHVENVTNMINMFNGANVFSRYPKNWGVPADGAAENMFTGTKVEAEAIGCADTRAVGLFLGDEF